MQKQILITAPAHPILLERFREKGYAVLYEPGISYTELTQRIATIHGLVVTTRLPIDAAILDRAIQLQWIGRLGSGMELIDEAYALQKNIRCFSTPEGNCHAVAEHVLGLILSLKNNIVKSHHEIKNNLWLRNENRGSEILGKTVGIIGYGHTGSAVAALLQPFHSIVLAYDKYKSGFARDYIREASLEQVCKYADIISFHVPLTQETRHTASTSFFNALERKPIIINACRGGVVDTAALITALKERKISAAGLDVLENEQLQSYTPVEREQLDWLLAQPNVVVTPHIAGYSEEAFFRMAEKLLEKTGVL